MKRSVDLVASEVFELAVVALVDCVDLYDLKDDLLELALVEGALADPPDVVQVERVMLLDVFLVVREQIVVDLQMSKSPSPFVVDSLLVGLAHRHNFLVLNRVFLCF